MMLAQNYAPIQNPTETPIQLQLEPNAASACLEDLAGGVFVRTGILRHLTFKAQTQNILQIKTSIIGLMVME